MWDLLSRGPACRNVRAAGRRQIRTPTNVGESPRCPTVMTRARFRCPTDHPLISHVRSCSVDRPPARLGNGFRRESCSKTKFESTTPHRRERIVLRMPRLVADTPGHRCTLVAFLAVLVSR